MPSSNSGYVLLFDLYTHLKYIRHLSIVLQDITLSCVYLCALRDVTIFCLIGRTVPHRGLSLMYYRRQPLQTLKTTGCNSGNCCYLWLLLSISFVRLFAESIAINTHLITDVSCKSDCACCILLNVLPCGLRFFGTLCKLGVLQEVTTIYFRITGRNKWSSSFLQRALDFPQSCQRAYSFLLFTLRACSLCTLFGDPITSDNPKWPLGNKHFDSALIFI